MTDRPSTAGPPPDVALWQRAAAFSARAHAGQRRKDGETPYAAHPARVALTLVMFGTATPTILAAALLHDTIEDTTVDYDELAEHFGAEVAEIVARLSKDARRPEPQREAAYDEGLAEGPWEARLIKLADVYDNLSDCRDDESRRKLAEKARRALALAEGDDRLAAGRRALVALVESLGLPRE